MNIPFVDLKAQYHAVKEEIDAAMEAVLENTAFIGGKPVAEFEAAFAEYIGGAMHCVSCANGTDAIEIALRGFGIGPGDEVIIPANTFMATAEGVTATGAKIVCADSEPDYFTLDVEDFRRKITPTTKAVIAVHLLGHPADMDPIMEIAKEHNLLVIEDSSQAQGARYKGRMVGSMGDAATYSFYPAKNLGAFGDAGAALFKDAAAADRGRLFANHGSREKFKHEIEGRNSRLDGLQAAVLTVKLRHLDEWNAARRTNAAIYTELLKDVEGVITPDVADYAEPVWHVYCIRVADRDALKEKLWERGIGTNIHYPISVPELEAYQYLGHTTEDFPIANTRMNEILSLPMYAELTEDMIRYVVENVRDLVPTKVTA